MALQGVIHRRGTAAVGTAVTTALTLVLAVAAGDVLRHVGVARSDVAYHSLPALTASEAARHSSLRHSERPYEAGVPMRVCKSDEENGRRQTCCKECKNCTVETSQCLNGSGACTCAGEPCHLQQAAWAKQYGRLPDSCYKTEQKCETVKETYTDRCHVCVPGTEQKYRCGEDCERVPRTILVPNIQKVDCTIPGQCRTTVLISKTCHAPSSGMTCKEVRVPKLARCTKRTVKDCTPTPTTERVCVSAKSPKTVCVTLLQPDGQKCSQAGGGDAHCRQVEDGVTKKCTLVDKRHTSCSTVSHKEQYNCRQVTNQRPGRCVTQLETRQECGRDVVADDSCRDVVKTEQKCALVMGFNTVCPTQRKRVCVVQQTRVKVENSCKLQVIPCVGYGASSNVSSRIRVAQGVRHQAHPGHNDCQTTGVVCKYEYKGINTCAVRDVPVAGKNCTKVPTYKRRCAPTTSTSRVCSPAPMTYVGVPGVVSTVSPSTAPLPAAAALLARASGACHADGIRCDGAAGLPHTGDLPCCTPGYTCREREGERGRFCLKDPWVANIYVRSYAGPATPTASPPTTGKPRTSPPATGSPTAAGCRTVQVPVTKCETIDYDETVCDYRDVEKPQCRDDSKPDVQCSDEKKYRQECSASTPGKVTCADQFREETKCADTYTESEVCRDVPVKSVTCKDRETLDCEPQGYTTQTVCAPGGSNSASCTEHKETKTVCDEPSQGKCQGPPEETSTVFDKRCKPVWCTKTTDQKCHEEPCSKARDVQKCRTTKVRHDCGPTPFECKRATYCTRKNVRCVAETCDTASCRLV
jgi:hypothetical protein